MHTREDILAKARELFSERGYHGTTMREMAKALDVTSATLYSHIDSKEAILWEIINRAAALFLMQARAVPQQLPLEEQLEKLIAGHLRVIMQELQYATVLFHEWKFLEPSSRELITEWRHEYEAYFRRVIEEGKRQGIFHVEDPTFATLFILSALNWTYQWYQPGEGITFEQLILYYRSFILSMLRDAAEG